MGSSIHAVEVAGHFGIAKDRAVKYMSDSEGTQTNYAVMSKLVNSFRGKSSIPEEYLDEISKNVKTREEHQKIASLYQNFKR